MLSTSTDVLIVGGSLGGVAAALGALRHGAKVILTEEYLWLGGQLTSQAVPPDEHRWVEQFGITRSYRSLRTAIRQYYKDHYPLSDVARQAPALNPGDGDVSALCHEPRVGVAVIDSLLMPYQSTGQLEVHRCVKPVSAVVKDGIIHSVTFRRVLQADSGTSVPLRSDQGGDEFTLSGSYVIDATELGDLLPLTNTPYVIGFESRNDTKEPSAPEVAQPQNQQAVSICFAVDHVDGVDNTIPKPEKYDYWRDFQPSFWPAKWLSFTAPKPSTMKAETREFPVNLPDEQRTMRGDMNLWTFRRIAARHNFKDGFYSSDICLVNWPMIDYIDAPIIDVPEEEYRRLLGEAAGLSKSMLYWLQTEAPRHDGKGKGYPGLRLRPDVMGTQDGLAMAPYIRESRRIKAISTITEQDLSLEIRGCKGAVHYRDTVGIGFYRIDLHPSTGGDNYIDLPSCPFEIPLGALIPRDPKSNLLAGCKNIGSTHITNGCYRLHPVEWNVGEVAGILAAHCSKTGAHPQEIQAEDQQLEQFQQILREDGIELHWPEVNGHIASTSHRSHMVKAEP